jgi:exopolysaccharide biosynthesis polyprenyl glycosylphosphotransferase
LSPEAPPAVELDARVAEEAARASDLARADARAKRPYLLSPKTIGALAARAADAAALIALDLVGLTAGILAALALREVYVGRTPIIWSGLWDTAWEWLPFLSVVTVLLFWRGGLYAERESRSGIGQILASLLLAAVLTICVALAAGHDFGTYGSIPTAYVLSAALVQLFRVGFARVERRCEATFGTRKRVLFLGSGAAVEGVRSRLPDTGASVDVATVPLAVEVLRSRPFDEVIVAERAFDTDELLDLMGEAHRRAVRMRVVPEASELVIRGGRLVIADGLPLLEVRPPVFTGLDWFVKRTFDLAVGGAILVLGLPLWLLVAAAVKLSSKGPVFHRDLRVGLCGREFAMLKFRTMRVGADARHSEAPEVALMKVRDDPRVTRVGRVLRRLSIDEVPQLLHVIRGEMSLVGPRPLPFREHRRLEGWQTKRNLVLPGMTGLWQISGRSDLGFDDLVRLDFFYIENWTIWLDISILLRTIPAVLAGRGAY